jgi:hypothetical protein
MFLWYSAAMLALEANHVIALRLSKMAFGGPVAHSEAKLMMTEKIDAAVEASYSLLKNGTSRRLLLVIVNTCRQMQIVSL